MLDNKVIYFILFFYMNQNAARINTSGHFAKPSNKVYVLRGRAFYTMTNTCM